MKGEDLFWGAAGLAVGIYAVDKLSKSQTKRRKKKTPKKARK